MSRLYGSLKGQAAKAVTRRGSVASGIESHVSGWDVGVQVVGRCDLMADVFDVFATSGSNQSTARTFIGHVQLVDGIPTFTPSDRYRG